MRENFIMSKSNRVTEKEFIEQIVSASGRSNFTYTEVKTFAAKNDIICPRSISKGSSVYATGRGLRDFSSVSSNVKPKKVVVPELKDSAIVEAVKDGAVFDEVDISNEPQNIVSIKSPKKVFNPESAHSEFEIEVPKLDPLYVAWGSFSKILTVLKSNKHFPIFLNGLSGNGKTMGIEQACAKANRKLITVNITNETDEDDLIGGFRLENGDTVFKYGAAIQAMKAGAVLLLDEVDMASHKIMALQSIIDGKGYYIKKTGEFVTPAKGFTVIATANTKGRGDDTGKFAGANILNEAFLERFAKYITQGYPAKKVENKILTQLLKHELEGEKLTEKDTTFVTNLVDWSDVIRASYKDGGVDDLITTRRLALAIKGYVIFGRDIEEAIEGAVERFDEDTADAFRELFQTVTGEDFNPEEPEVEVSKNPWEESTVGTSNNTF